MEFTPNINQKICKLPTEVTRPFPILSDERKIIGIFTGISVEIAEKRDIIEIYENGNYGKGSLSRSVPEFIRNSLNIEEQIKSSSNETLVLNLEEAFFLFYFLKVLEIQDIHSVVLDTKEVFTHFCNLKTDFLVSMIGYLYLKSKNWVVKSGIKFGGDFLIYKKGLRYFHASFLVLINYKSFKPRDIKGILRVAENSDKNVLLLDIQPPPNAKAIDTDDNFHVLDEFGKSVIREMIVKRINFNQFVHK